VEVDVLKQHSRHENITSFYGIYGVKTPPNEDDKLWLCMEYCGGGTITDLCKKLLPKKLPEIVFAFVLRETLQALEYLHQNGVVHRDIKGQNILITDNGEIRLSKSAPRGARPLHARPPPESATLLLVA